MLCHIVISPVLGGMTITGTGVVVTEGCQWLPPPVVPPVVVPVAGISTAARR